MNDRKRKPSARQAWDFLDKMKAEIFRFPVNRPGHYKWGCNFLDDENELIQGTGKTPLEAVLKAMAGGDK